ncbi:YhgE/Pip domain-containing protein, partial [Erysipelatoclostridium ramosum]|uniref:hypothetical protein n=1 Tax=Thomasclavelia ramosa TaxID=1547 RepID=UPI003F68376E|nr:YhgE/Pip domain-containing protein [Thomasclavelia ramosa]
LQQGSEQLMQRSAALYQGIDTLAQGTAALHTGSSDVLSGLQKLSSALTSSTRDHASMLAYLHAENSGSANSLQQLSQGASALNAQLQAIITKNTACSCILR